MTYLPSRTHTSFGPTRAALQAQNQSRNGRTFGYAGKTIRIAIVHMPLFRSAMLGTVTQKMPPMSLLGMLYISIQISISSTRVDKNYADVSYFLCRNHGANTTSRYYFYIWRFGWVFYIIALFFTVCALFSGVFACLGRLGARLAGLASIFALVFYTVAVSLMTYVFHQTIALRNILKKI